MNWRDILVGSISTLVVTVIGGVVIYYLTREPPDVPPAERLVYDVDTPVAFKSDQTKLSFTNVRIKNSGNKVAQNTSIVVQFGDKANVVDQHVTLSSTPAGVFTAKKDAHEVSVDIPRLTPNETATVAIITDAVDGDRPTVGVKSDETTGKKGSLSESTTNERSGTRHLDRFLAIIVPLSFLLQVGLLFVFRKSLRKMLRRVLPNFRSTNNTAFVYLHQGLTKEAHELLSKGISTAGA